MTSETSASETLVELDAAVETARRRVGELEGEQGTAVQDVQAASVALADLERRALGGEKISQATREQAEEELARARSTTAEPWDERIAGARSAIRDAEHRVQVFTGEHFSELVGELEVASEAVAARLTAAAQQLVDAYVERERIAGQISRLASSVGRLYPGDVQRSAAEPAVREAQRLIEQGGEVPPVLGRDPRVPRYGAIADVSA
jgi:hypothetical protein